MRKNLFYIEKTYMIFHFFLQFKKLLRIAQFEIRSYSNLLIKMIKKEDGKCSMSCAKIHVLHIQGWVVDFCGKGPLFNNFFKRWI